MDIYSMEFHFYCPANQFYLNVDLLREAARKHGIYCKVLLTRDFRNLQRFGTRSTEGLLRFSGTDRKTLKRFVKSISFE